MAKTVIYHCGKHLITEKCFVAPNKPFPGDETVLFSAFCPECEHTAYAYYENYLIRKTETRFGTELEQADKNDRQRFDGYILDGVALEVQPKQKDLRDTTATPIVSDWTKLISKDPAVVFSKLLRQIA